MKRNMFLCLSLFLVCVFFFAAQTQAKAKSTFVALPFSVEGPSGFAYLEQSVPQMFVSRLYWKDKVEALQQASKQPVADAATAERMRKNVNADYVVWGRVSVVGQDSTLEVHVNHKSGKVWHYLSEAKTNQFMVAIKDVGDRINKEIFNRVEVAPLAPDFSSAASRTDTGRVNQMNPNLVINETTPKEIYLNPHIRYDSATAGGDSASIRSIALPFVGIGMEVVDGDGDGRNEVFVLEDFNLHAYRFEGNEFKPCGTLALPRTLDPFALRSYVEPSGKVTLIINAMDTDSRPSAMFISYKSNQFTIDASGIKYFLNVVKIPPAYRTIIVGQQAQPPKLFRPGVFEMTKSGNTLIQGNRLPLPDEINALNFTYLPGGYDENGGDKLIALSPAERLRVYTTQGSRISETEESYSGSSKGFEVDNRMPGMGNERVTIKDQYYVPIRMLTANFDMDDKYELIVTRPHSTASKVFDRYRFFPQAEVQSLTWDGLGLGLQWKTRRIKGAVADIAIADVNNDGILDLVTLINTHPGAIGVKARKTIVQAFPLDLTSVDPNTPSHSVFNENN